MYKACPYCGRIHRQGEKCSAFKRIYTGGNERKLRSTYAWTEKSKEIRENAQGLCEVCRDKGIYTYKGVQVHHIEKVKDNPSKLLDNYNLVCLCEEHHKQADDGKLDADYLRKLSKTREES